MTYKGRDVIALTWLRGGRYCVIPTRPDPENADPSCGDLAGDGALRRSAVVERRGGGRVRVANRGGTGRAGVRPAADRLASTGRAGGETSPGAAGGVCRSSRIGRR